MKGNKKRLEILVFFLFDWQQKKHGENTERTLEVHLLFLEYS